MGCGADAHHTPRNGPPDVTALAIRVEHETNALWPRGAAPIVAFQGERGAYGDLAIGAVWGAGAFPLACWDFEGVVAAVRGMPPKNVYYNLLSTLGVVFRLPANLIFPLYKSYLSYVS